METETLKTPRLLEAAKEFNIGKETLVAFLAGKNFEIGQKTNTRLTEPMYNAIQTGFAQHKLVRRSSEQLVLGLNKCNLPELAEQIHIPGMPDRHSPYHVI